MKVWMWQRLCKITGQSHVEPIVMALEDDEWLQSSHEEMAEENLIWLCPKPNLVLVDRKHLGGME
jgi:hypothetical protein